MRAESKAVKKLIAVAFLTINEMNREKGINAQYQYKIRSEEQEDKESTLIKKEMTISIAEMGYPLRDLQTFRFSFPKSTDLFTVEYNIYTSLLTAVMEISLLTWDHLGKSLNTDPEFQKEAIKSLNHDKEINTNTDKR